MTINITLCFSQQQAAAMYAATNGTKQPAYVSPFVGRLDDIGQNGMDVIRNIKQMFRKGDGHVLVLAASIRTLEHLLYCRSRIGACNRPCEGLGTVGEQEFPDARQTVSVQGFR